MNTQDRNAMHVPLMFAGAAILLSTMAFAIVSITGWIQDSPESTDGTFAQEQSGEPSAPLALAQFGAAKTLLKVPCEECGVIASMRHVAAVGEFPASYETTVRLGDGSTRVFSGASPANWRPGERMTFIGGGTRPPK